MVDRPPRPQPEIDDREIDYLICKQCNTPCYIFEIELGNVSEAQCLVCGNEEPKMFELGEEIGSEDESRPR
jgi:translation initiation factor 2 beta subunit (eIF-2beta)/eIF-5